MQREIMHKIMANDNISVDVKNDKNLCKSANPLHLATPTSPLILRQRPEPRMDTYDSTFPVKSEGARFYICGHESHFCVFSI